MPSLSIRRIALNQIMTGSIIQEATPEAGFSDSSYFHNLLISMFGISASQFIKGSANFRTLTCPEATLVYDVNNLVLQTYRV
jgi:AraC-like DNA-binding protein